MIDYKVGDWIVFINSHFGAMQIKVITKDKKRFRSYRAVNGAFWHDFKSIRKAEPKEIDESKKRIRA